jgi:predicted Rdx family selenoprotein
MPAIDSERSPSQVIDWTPDRRMKQVLWWICLLAAPLVLITIELFHPANFTVSPGMYEFLSHAEHYDPTYQALGYFGPEWWFALHMIQTPMVGLVAVGLWLMVDDVGGADGSAAMVCAWLARAAIFVFAVYFTVLDAIGRIGLGRTIVVVESLKLDDKQLDPIKMLLNRMWTDPLVGGVGSYVSLTASWAAFVASVLVAATLLLSSRAGWLNMAVLVGFGWQLQESHAALHGPIAFALLIVASGWLWWTRRRRGQLASIA